MNFVIIIFLEMHNSQREWISKRQCFQHQEKNWAKVLNGVKIYKHTEH